MKNSFYHKAKLGALAMFLLTLAGCQEDFNSPTTAEVNAATDLQVKSTNYNIVYYALEDGVKLHRFNTDNPEKITKVINFTGLQPNEKIIAIDFRPATGQLYGLSSDSRLYVINLNSGVASMIGAGPFTPALKGKLAGFDFNPTVDRIRIVTNSGQNLRVNPETGTVAFEDLDINGPAGAMISAVAYTNSMAGAATTTLYDLDVSQQKLYKQDPPNDGKLVEVGALNLKITDAGGFDIAPKNNKGLGLFPVDGRATLFTVDLMTGKAEVLYKYQQSRSYTAIAIPTDPVAYAVSRMNELLIFNPEKPAEIITKPIMGLQANEKVLGIDFRPKNGQLYALGSTNRIYTLNASSGLAAEVGKLTVPLKGMYFGFDFNPVADRIRIVSNKWQNLRVNPDDATVTEDATLNGGAGEMTIVGAAYTNSFAGATATELFVIGVGEDKLYLQSPPNAGTLNLRGTMGVNVNAANGFDIGASSGKAYAILTTKKGKIDDTTKWYSINTTTGKATAVADFKSTVNGFTIGLGF